MASHYSLEQRFSLVLDCYKSGLSIPSWCKEKGIAPGTFYGWIKQVSNKGYDVPVEYLLCIVCCNSNKYYE